MVTLGNDCAASRCTGCVWLGINDRSIQIKNGRYAESNKHSLGLTSIFSTI